VVYACLGVQIIFHLVIGEKVTVLPPPTPPTPTAHPHSTQVLTYGANVDLFAARDKVLYELDEGQFVDPLVYKVNLDVVTYAQGYHGENQNGEKILKKSKEMIDILVNCLHGPGGSFRLPVFLFFSGSNTANTAIQSVSTEMNYGRLSFTRSTRDGGLRASGLVPTTFASPVNPLIRQWRDVSNKLENYDYDPTQRRMDGLIMHILFGIFLLFTW
jgi:hypothetical protein